MNYEEFHNGLRVLLNIENDEFAEATGETSYTAFDLFSRKPHDWFIRAGDQRALGLFAIIAERNAKSAVVQTSLEAEDPA